MVDVGGQDIMTADKVTLRLNAVVTYKIVDARKAVSRTDDVRQALYRETAVRPHCTSYRSAAMIKLSNNHNAV